MTPILHVEQISKRYRLGSAQRKWPTFREAIGDAVRWPWTQFRRLSGHIADHEEFWALRDVSFDVQPGEVVGIIGRNGAGKSTLLKVLSRITEPTTGRVTLHGRVASLLEVGTGFHLELSGRENIFLNGAILGMPHAEIKRKFDEIVAFAEVERFLDTQVKHYSSGMYVRLAFSVAAHLEPEILNIDEVLAVGDVGFQRKCMEHIKKLTRSGVTTLIVSHNMFAVKAMCRRAIVLKAGAVAFDGAVADGIEQYERDSRLEADPWAVGVIGKGMQHWPIVISKVEVLDESNQKRTVFNHGERMRIRIHYDVRRPVKHPNFSVGIRRSDNVFCCSFSAARDGLTVPTLEAGGIVELLTPPLRLVSELYGTHVGVWDQDFKTLYCGQIGPLFHIRDELLNAEFGVFHEAGQWQWLPDSARLTGPDVAPTTEDLVQ